MSGEGGAGGGVAYSGDGERGDVAGVRGGGEDGREEEGF